MLLLTTGLLLAALGATVGHQNPSGLQVLVTAVVGLLAPLFWPGNAASPKRTALRIAVWSTSAAGLALITLRILGHPSLPLSRILPSCGVLMLILLAAHAAAAILEERFRGQSGDAQGAREMAGRSVVIALALLGSMPLWLGPVAELLSARQAWIIDAVIGLSPLTHLAVVSGNDLLRNPWFYEHSNLAALQFSYPGLAELALFYAVLALMLALIASATRRWRRPNPH